MTWTTPAWGIAYDGQYMWITHHDGFRRGDGDKYGKLTRVNVCTLERWTFERHAQVRGVCRIVTGFRKKKVRKKSASQDNSRLKPYAGEVVLHDGDIYVAHDLRIKHRSGTSTSGTTAQPGTTVRSGTATAARAVTTAL